MSVKCVVAKARKGILEDLVLDDCLFNSEMICAMLDCYIIWSIRLATVVGRENDPMGPRTSESAKRIADQLFLLSYGFSNLSPAFCPISPWKIEGIQVGIFQGSQINS